MLVIEYNEAAAVLRLVHVSHCCWRQVQSHNLFTCEKICSSGMDNRLDGVAVLSMGSCNIFND